MATATYHLPKSRARSEPRAARAQAPSGETHKKSRPGLVQTVWAFACAEAAGTHGAARIILRKHSQ